MTNLQQITQKTKTKLWLDSVAIQEMEYALDNGAVGVTCNPIIALKTINKELSIWEPVIKSLIEEYPNATEDELGWLLVRQISMERSKLLMPSFDKYNGKYGRLSIQIDPRIYRDSKRMIEQAVNFSQISENIIVKIPGLEEGLIAIEEATYKGVSVNATVSFTVSQVIAIAEAIERGLKRREQEHKDISRMGPVCTIMLGRMDDYYKNLGEKRGLKLSPEYYAWCGIAVFKKAFKIFEERGYRVKLLAAAFRSNLHISELIGGEYVLSPAYIYQQKFNDSKLLLDLDSIYKPVDSKIVDSLLMIPEFKYAYEVDGMKSCDFERFIPSKIALTEFAQSCNELAQLIRRYLINMNE